MSRMSEVRLGGVSYNIDHMDAPRLIVFRVQNPGGAFSQLVASLLSLKMKNHKGPGINRMRILDFDMDL